MAKTIIRLTESELNKMIRNLTIRKLISEGVLGDGWRDPYGPARVTPNETPLQEDDADDVLNNYEAFEDDGYDPRELHKGLWPFEDMDEWPEEEIENYFKDNEADTMISLGKDNPSL